jgi:signal transduction histidine kinase
LYWTFSIEDNGIGLKEKYLETIFEPFKRLHVQKEFDGSGLGLASCKKIIEKHQGKIWATSVLNKGTTIHFSIKK